MILGKPAPFVSAFIDAVDDAIRASQPHHGMSAMQRAWLAFCVTAVVVTNSICWARFARASLGTYSLAALSWMFRHSKIPWDELLVASVRVILHHHGITSGSLLIDDTDNPRSKAAHTLAYLYKLRALLLDSRVLPDQQLNECRKQRFASLADVVHELEEPQVDREFFLGRSYGSLGS